MSCVMSHCSKELSACMSNPQCAQGLGCFMTCAAQKQEGACQVRCTDLHENEQLRRFTKCTLADRQCYPALAADARYPSLPSNLWETNTLNKDFLSKLLRGRWYISAGLNEAFDCFDCQVHDFEQPRNQQHVADAVFSYRIKTDGDNFRTKEGKKHLAIVANSGEQIETEAPSFVSGKKWGIDAFSPSSSHPTTTDTKLILTIDPNYMDYADEWTVLSSDVDQYMVVAYRGTNAAWKGYGGLNVYTREPVSSFDDVQPFVRKGIELGLAKVGLTLQDLHVVDNSCK